MERPKRAKHPAAAQAPAVPAPRVEVTVNIRPGPLPKDLGKLKGGAALPEHVADRLNEVEARLFKHLEAHPEEGARFLSDPIGVLRSVAPKETDLHGTLGAARETSGSIMPDVPDVQLASLKVNVAKRPRRKGK